MEPRHPDWRANVERVLANAPFIQHLGITPMYLAPGVCHTRMTVRPELLQHSGVVHAGVLTTLADHTAGAAAGTLITPEETLVSVEFKVHLLRGATGPELTCHAEVVRPGRRFTVVEADVFDGDRAVLRLLGTMAGV